MAHSLQFQRGMRYCPNKNCNNHLNPEGSWFHKSGFYYPKKGGRVQRLICKQCGRKFSQRFFTLEYWEHKKNINESIFLSVIAGLSNREIARRLLVSEDLVRNRITKMARWCYLEHTHLIKDLKISEPIVYDGLENFAKSQYDINNINHAIGKQSLFMYDFGFAPMNRKGRMSPRQRKKKKFLEDRFGRYPGQAIRSNTVELFKRLLGKVPQDQFLHICSDKHYQYKKAVNIDLKGLIKHQTTSSTQYRNFNNPLFAVNHMDMLTRQNLAVFKRETISFAKHHFGMIDKFILYSSYKNYFRPKFTKKHKRDPISNAHSPAMYLNITDQLHTFKSFFSFRKSIQRVKLSSEWLTFYQRNNPYPQMNVKPYKGI